MGYKNTEASKLAPRKQLRHLRGAKTAPTYVLATGESVSTDPLHRIRLQSLCGRVGTGLKLLDANAKMLRSGCWNALPAGESSALQTTKPRGLAADHVTYADFVPTLTSVSAKNRRKDGWV